MLVPALVVLLGQAPASACTTADEPAFATTKEHPVQVGGGAMYVAARERRYLDALRGPMGEPVQYKRTGSIPVDPEGRTILDRYEVSYPGLDKPLALFLDAYHFDEGLRAPKGFTCAVPFGLNAPGPDPMLASESAFELAVEQGAAKAFAPISLDADGSATHGVIFDRFRLLAHAAQAAAAAGQPIDVKQPPRELVRGMVVVAHPARCGDKGSVPPASIEIVPAQGAPPPRTGDLATGDALARLVPGVGFPDGSMGAAFALDHPRPTDSIRLSYPDGACGAAMAVLLPMKFASARPIDTPMPARPAGQAPTDRPVRLQALVDFDGRAQRIVYMGGPVALREAAIAAVRTWTAEPARLNGAPMVAPVTFQVKFGPQ
jgi:hypothetical protein